MTKYALILALFGLLGYQHTEITRLKQAQQAQVGLNREFTAVARMLNDATTMQENRYYTLRELINAKE